MSDNIILEKFDTKRVENYNGIKQFDCGHNKINKFCRETLKQHVERDYATAYVLLDEDKAKKFVGFYTITPYYINRFDTKPGEYTFDSGPRPIPVIRLVMLGVSLDYAKKGHGQSLLAHAMKQTLDISEKIAVKGLYLDAEDGRHQYYKDRAFISVGELNEENILPMFVDKVTIKNAIDG